MGEIDELFNLGGNNKPRRGVDKKSHQAANEDVEEQEVEEVEEEEEEIDFDEVDEREDKIFSAFLNGKMKSLMRKPEKGAMLSKLKNTKDKKSLEKVGMNFVEEWATTYFTTDSSMSFFIFCRIFMSHSTCMMLMERIEELRENEPFDEKEGFELLSNAFKVSIKERKDLQGAIKKAARYHPALISKVKNLFGNRFKG